MAEIASAWVSLLPSAKGFGRKLDADIGPDLDKSGKAGGKRFGGAFSKVVGPALGLAVGAAAVDLLKDSIGEAREAQKVGALTASTIKATGAAAKVSAREVGALAAVLSSKTGIDDEVIQSGQNMLLTFKNIRNEAGKGNDIFNQSTKALIDMSAAMGTEPRQAAIQLGKALNDPIKGVTALGRAGVQFTDGQKDQIKTLVQSGKTLDAQKIILKELESQFGGSAAAQATAGDKMAVAIGNLKEQIGVALLPVIDRFATIITTKVVPAFSTFVAFLQKNPQVIVAVAAAIGGLVVALTAMFIAANVIPVAIGAVVAGLVYAYTRFETFRKIVDTVMTLVKFYVLTNIKIVSAVIRGVWSAISAAIGFFRSLYTNVRDFIGKVVTKVREVKSAITGAFKGAKDWLKNVGRDIIQGLINGIGEKFKDVKNKLGDLTGKLTSWKGPASLDKVILKSSGQYVIDGFITGLESRFPQVQSTLGGLTSGLNESVRVPAGARFDAAASNAASSNAGNLELIRGELSIDKDGRAWIEGVAQRVVDDQDFKNTVKSRTPGAFAGSMS